MPASVRSTRRLAHWNQLAVWLSVLTEQSTVCSGAVRLPSDITNDKLLVYIRISLQHLFPSLPLEHKTWTCCCLSGARSPDQGPGVETQEFGLGTLSMRVMFREAGANVGKDTASSYACWAEICNPPKGTEWSKFARPELSLMHSEDVKHMPDSAMAFLAQGLLQL